MTFRGRILFPNSDFPHEIKTIKKGNKGPRLAVWISETRPGAARATWIKTQLAPLRSHNRYAGKPAIHGT
jgi:hypothetical protein